MAASFCAKIAKKVDGTEYFEELYQVPFDIIKPTQKCGRNLNILILNTPCNGFGDLVFAWKLAKILRSAHGSKVTIATTLSNSLIGLGEDPQNVLRLASSASASEKHKGQTQCRRYARLKLFKGSKPVNTNNFDVFLDAPVVADFEPDIKGIRKLVPKATYFNTFFFSEYNDELDKGFDFNTGVGGGRDGILLLPPSLIEIAGRLEITQLLETGKYGSFALSYIGPWERWEECVAQFAKMIAAKYKFDRFQLLAPAFAAKMMSFEKKARQIFSPYYQKVVFFLKENDKEKTVEREFSGGKGKGGTLYVRGDIFPQPNKVMLGLIKYSVEDVLLTGDQSITDALSCCSNKNIFYQIAPWKENLGSNLATLMPQRFLKSIKTSCGSLSAIKYQSNYKEFVKKWSFMKLAKPQLDRIICVSSAVKEGTPQGVILKEYMEAVNTSWTIEEVEKKLF